MVYIYNEGDITYQNSNLKADYMQINMDTNYTLNPQFNEMTGFTEKDVRDMLEYYSTTCPFNHSVDELIELIAFLLRNADHQRNA